MALRIILTGLITCIACFEASAGNCANSIGLSSMTRVKIVYSERELPEFQFQEQLFDQGVTKSIARNPFEMSNLGRIHEISISDGRFVEVFFARNKRLNLKSWTRDMAFRMIRSIDNPHPENHGFSQQETRLIASSVYDVKSLRGTLGNIFERRFVHPDWRETGLFPGIPQETFDDRGSPDAQPFISPDDNPYGVRATIDAEEKLQSLDLGGLPGGIYSLRIESSVLSKERIYRQFLFVLTGPR